MKKIFLSFVFSIILLSACNLPLETLPSADIVATQVAKILTETAENPIGITTHTDIALTETAENDIPLQETPVISNSDTPQPTFTNTFTPEFTATSIATLVPSATMDQSDPAVKLGNPDWVDDFSSSSSKWDYEDDWAIFKVEDGYLKIRSTTTPYWNSWNLSTPKIQNFYLEMIFAMPLCSGGDRIGLVFRGPDITHFYFMGITCDAKWGFDMYTEQETPLINILPYTSTPLLLPADQFNRAGVLADDNTIEFYINGFKVGEIIDDTFNEAGYIGFISRYTETQGFTSHIDKLQYWLLP